MAKWPVRYYLVPEEISSEASFKPKYYTLEERSVARMIERHSKLDGVPYRAVAATTADPEWSGRQLKEMPSV